MRWLTAAFLIAFAVCVSCALLSAYSDAWWTVFYATPAAAALLGLGLVARGRRDEGWLVVSGMVAAAVALMLTLVVLMAVLPYS